jgi:hypothetical protein
MCDEYSGPVNAYKKLNIRQLHLPTVDHFEPSLSQMHEAVAFIESFRQRGEKVYVHCKAGHGRAASIALVWLLSRNPRMASRVGPILFVISFNFIVNACNLLCHNLVASGCKYFITGDS